MDKLIRIEELCTTFSGGLPEDEAAANLTWLTTLHGLLNEGGIWVSPELGLIYKRYGIGFTEVGIFGATVRTNDGE